MTTCRVATCDRPVTDANICMRLAPWRDVLADPKPELRERLGDTGGVGRWHLLTLSCGHRIERRVRYTKRSAMERRLGWDRSASDIRAPAKRVRCELCRDLEANQ